MVRAALFTVVGVAFLAHWLLADPSYEASEFQKDRNYVLGVSAAFGALAVALPMYAHLVGGRVVFRASLVAAAGASLSSIANIVEDGLQIGAAFWAFIVGSAIMLVGLLALTGVIGFERRGRHRLLALVPAGTMGAIIFYVVAGGPVMVATWLAAAAVALAVPTRTAGFSAPLRP